MSDDANEDDMDDVVLNQPPPTIAEVTVKGPGVSITRPVDEAMMAKIIAILFGAAPAVRSGGGTDGGGTGGGGQQPSKWDENITLGEFISDTEASTFQQKICATGYHLMHLQGRASFSREDVRTALADAHEDMPANYARDFNSAASSHLIATKQGESGQYIIPRTGRTAIDARFQDVRKRRATRKTAKRANSKGDPE